MHHAAYKSHVRMCALLFQRGARLDIKDVQGKIPLDVALLNQSADTVTFLRLASLRRLEENDPNFNASDSVEHALKSLMQDMMTSNSEDISLSPPAQTGTLLTFDDCWET